MRLIGNDLEVAIGRTAATVEAHIVGITFSLVSEAGQAEAVFGGSGLGG